MWIWFFPPWTKSASPPLSTRGNRESDGGTRLLARAGDYRHWTYPGISIPVEFPPGPLQIGHWVLQELNEIEIQGTKLRILKVEDIPLDRTVMAREWGDLAAKVQAEMLMYAHYEEMDWPYVHRQASRIGVLELVLEIQKKVKRRMRRKSEND